MSDNYIWHLNKYGDNVIFKFNGYQSETIKAVERHRISQIAKIFILKKICSYKL